MPRASLIPPVLSLVLAVVAVLSGCSDKAECTAEVADGNASYKGRAAGKKGEAKLERDAIRDACRQMCAASKAEMLDACASRCLADVDGKKLGAKTSCTDR